MNTYRCLKFRFVKITPIPQVLAPRKLTDVWETTLQDRWTRTYIYVKKTVNWRERISPVNKIIQNKGRLNIIKNDRRNSSQERKNLF